MSKPQSFIGYWDAVDAALMKLYAVDTFDAGIEADEIAGAQEECQTPEEFARWFGEKHDLTLLNGGKVDLITRTRMKAAAKTV